MATIRLSTCALRSTCGRVDNRPPRFRPGNYGTNHDKTRPARQAAADFVVLLPRAFPSHGRGRSSIPTAPTSLRCFAASPDKGTLPETREGGPFGGRRSGQVHREAFEIGERAVAQSVFVRSA